LTVAQVDISRAAGVQIEPTVAADPARPNVLVASSALGRGCGPDLYESVDGGRSWRSETLRTPRGQPLANGRCAGNPWVGMDASGRAYVVFTAFTPSSGPSLFFAVKPSPTAPWRFTANPDRPVRGSFFDDKPTVAVDVSSASPHRGRIYVAWTRYAGSVAQGQVQYVQVAHSDDQGMTWSQPYRLTDDIGGWGVHLAVASNGTVYAAWWSGAFLQGRVSADGGETFAPLRAFATTSQGVFQASIPAKPSGVHPDPSLDVAGAGRFAGRVYAAYSKPTRRGRRVYVIVLASDLRPLFTRAVAGVQAGTFDEFNPTVAVDQSNGGAWVCFYVTGSGKRRTYATYSCSTSFTGGSIWTRRRAAASVPSNETQRGAYRGILGNPGIDREYGAYEGVVAARGVAHPIWTDTRRLKMLGEEIYTATLKQPRG
jgi:hypothetical protein